MKYLMQLLLLVGILCVSFAQQDPVVSTIYGDIRGQVRETSAGGLFEEFLGVPFAQPPLNDLRWQKPVDPESWDGVRDAQTFSRMCTQTGSLAASEDCLYLNVYVPASSKELLSKDETLPVLFYIHGGAFVYGSAINYDGGLLSTKGNVILVTTNYRVSTLGFFSSQSDAAPGNYGLWDQIAALRWVRDNIAAFGGDVSRVTVMGQSAGSASVSHLSLSPAATGLFQRVILVSGSAASYFGYTSHQRLTSYRLSNHFDCPTTPDAAAVECLRGQSAFSLDLYGLAYPPLMDQYIATQIPVIDGELVSVRPIDAMTSGLNANYDLLAGATTHDAAVFALPFTGSVEITNDFLNFAFAAFENRDQVVPLILERYPDLTNENLDKRQRAIVKVTTDFIFGSRALKESELHYQTSSRSTYLYDFRHQFDSTEPSWLEGVHGEDLAFIFGRDFLTGKDLQLSDYIMAYYSNFVYTGNPNEGPHSVPVQWPHFNPDTKQRLVETPEPFIEDTPQDLLADWEFWDGIYDMLIPRVDTGDNVDGFNPEMLQMWNTLAAAIEKSSKP